ncbi:MAG: ATP-binding protein [Elainella sp. Prado103]|jgi:signal transduction histidine kinase|nr:ATP-binding protein [Elainella sp. Prado103]
MLCIEDLLQLELFQSLPEDRLRWVCDRAVEIRLQPSEMLAKQGDVPRGFFVLAEGKIAIFRQSGGVDMPIGQHEAPGFFGEIPVLTDEPMLVSFRAITPCRVHEISSDDFRTILHDCRDFERIVFRTVQKRLRGLESFIQGREKMAALGTLAAGLAHELNNPAAALVRALKDVPQALIELERMSLVYGQRQVDAEHTQEWLAARDRGFNHILHHPLDNLTLGDREEQILDWLEDYGVASAWKLAAPLAAGGIVPQELDHLMERWRNDPTELRDMGLRWLGLSFDVMGLVSSGLRGAERISELIRSMKSYSYMDRGVQQFVDVHAGIEDTLKLFSYKLKQGIEVQRQYASHVPQVLAFGSELNQVWTNLIDNAIDAMNDKGTLTIQSDWAEEYVQVKIIDTGAGIPADVISRIYEPFFTTKPVGKGTGLGLDITRRIVENRHQGILKCQSRPGQTCFTVCLPIQPPQVLTPAE